MVCPKCGAAVEEQLSFCPQCGTAMRQEREPVLVTAGASAGTMNAEPEGSVEPTAVPEPAVSAEGVAVQSEVGEPEAVVDLPSRNKKPWKALLIAGLCLLAAGALVLTGYLVYPRVMMAVYGPSKYYAMQESKNLETMRQSLSAVEQAIKPQTTTGEYQLEMDVSDLDLGSDAANDMYSQILSDIRVGIESRSDPEKEVSAAEMEILIGDKPLMTLLMEQRDGRMGISFPDIVDGQIVSESSGLMTLFEDGKIAGLTQEQLQDMLSEYMEDVVFTPLDAGTVNKGKATYAGISCTTHEFVLDKNLLQAMADALATKLETDDRLVSLLTEILSEAATTDTELSLETMDEEYVREAMQEAAIKLRAAAEEIEAESPSAFKVYYDNRGRLVARELTVPDEDELLSVVLASYPQGEKVVYELSMKNTMPDEDNTQSLRLFWETADADGRLVGTMKCTWDDGETVTDVVRVTYELRETTVSGLAANEGDLQIALTIPGQDVAISVSVKMEKTGDDTLRSEYSMDMGFNGQSISAQITGTQTVKEGADVSDVSVAEETTLDEEDMTALEQALVQNLMSILYSDMLV